MNSTPNDPSWLDFTSTLDPMAKAAARAARARTRKLRRRLAWGCGILVVLAIVAGALALAGVTFSGLVSHPTDNGPYSDSLTTTATGWAQDEGCGEQNGAYHVAPLNTHTGVTCFAPAGRYSNLDEQVTAQQVAGAGDGYYGLAFRVVDLSEEYIFAVSNDGNAFVGKVAQNNDTRISPIWTYHAFSGYPQTLRVVAHGSTITCYIDGTQVGTLTDNSYTVGTVGLFVGSGGLDVAFTNFSVKNA